MNLYKKNAAATDDFIAENLSDLPDLTGSPKQVSWAQDIRRTLIFELANDNFSIVRELFGSKWLRCTRYFDAKRERLIFRDRFEETTDSQRVAALRALINATTRARYWIDKRDDVPEVVVDYLDELFSRDEQDY